MSFIINDICTHTRFRSDRVTEDLTQNFTLFLKIGRFYLFLLMNWHLLCAWLWCRMLLISEVCLFSLHYIFGMALYFKSLCWSLGFMSVLCV